MIRVATDALVALLGFGFVVLGREVLRLRDRVTRLERNGGHE